jgi:hypothetical protein
MSSEDWRFANWLIAEARHERDEALAEVERLRKAIQEHRRFLGPAARSWDDRLYAALHPDKREDEG